MLHDHQGQVEEKPTGLRLRKQMPSWRKMPKRVRLWRTKRVVIHEEDIDEDEDEDEEEDEDDDDR
eukprot:2946758-Amphidinium_carterae.1